MSGPSDALSTRESLYAFYKKTFAELSPHYLRIFDGYARDLKLSYEQILLEIDDDQWRSNAYARCLDERRYRISITRGLFERLIYLVNLLVRAPRNRSVLFVSSCDFFWKDPEVSLYDYRDDSDLLLTDAKLRPLLAAYNDGAAYERDFDAYWGVSWPAAEVQDRAKVGPVFLVIDFVVFHEMSHIQLRHLEKSEAARKLGVISETSGSAEEPGDRRRLIEGHADFHATSMLIATLPALQQAARGDPIDATMQDVMSTLAFLMMGLFAFWGRTRKSLTLQDSFLHPHPEFRKLLFLETVERTLLRQPAARQAWISRAQVANHDIQNAYSTIGAPGVADTIQNEFAGVNQETLRAWQAKFYEKYDEYVASLREFTQHMTVYLQPPNSYPAAPH
jgi:hypothetical protein